MSNEIRPPGVVYEEASAWERDGFFVVLKIVVYLSLGVHVTLSRTYKITKRKNVELNSSKTTPKTMPDRGRLAQSLDGILEDYFFLNLLCQCEFRGQIATF